LIFFFIGVLNLGATYIINGFFGGDGFIASSCFTMKEVHLFEILAFWTSIVFGELLELFVLFELDGNLQ
jgi:hypothetical protein